MTVTLFAKPEGTCVPCTATEKAFIKNGIEYTRIDITESPEALDRILALGHLAAPVVIVEETGENWSGFRLDKIATLVA